ncbi:hypothetical protein VPHG_00166 [Vibrio phage 11895-B1]|uniref:hypothetical protein n=1 Tax=Vibrio phage 11895-B1 TaxID=754075 RepID=UPI0002C0EF39|nr:hypothetical protein VPHG_00166 [Vibrio phage 11895-B1]AGH32229.1 hypothetical protein VPHG_00166 [Vibrio phage 11895-B1]
MIILHCGCEVSCDETRIPVRMKSESIDMFEGWVPSVQYLEVCNQCYEERYSKYEDTIFTDEQEDEWLNSMSKF